MTPGELLRNGIRKIGLESQDRQIESFLAYLSELRKWNRAYNLTGLTSDRDIVVKHFLDSLLFMKALPPHTRTAADVGSGAGFPGVPLSIMNPFLKVCLIEPTSKKALFLEHICSHLSLNNTEVICKRVEDIDLKFDAAFTRALFKAGDFIKKTGHILRKDGVLILSKGPRVEEELRAIPVGILTRMELVLPFEGTVRNIVILRPQTH